jgi:hypothetical protein
VWLRASFGVGSETAPSTDPRLRLANLRAKAQRHARIWHQGDVHLGPRATRTREASRRRAQTKRRHKDAEHLCEARAIDEEMGESHGVDPGLALVSTHGVMDRAASGATFAPGAACGMPSMMT